MILLYVPLNYGVGKVKPDIPFSINLIYLFLIDTKKSSNGPRFPESSIAGDREIKEGKVV
jgi:hypothetical protein